MSEQPPARERIAQLVEESLEIVRDACVNLDEMEAIGLVESQLASLTATVEQQRERIAELERERDEANEIDEEIIASQIIHGVKVLMALRTLCHTISDSDEGGELWKQIAAMSAMEAIAYLERQDELNDQFVQSLCEKLAAATERAERAEKERDGLGDRVAAQAREIERLKAGRARNFMLYVEQEAKRTGVDPLTVLANEWAAHSKLKDESLWPDQSKLAAFAPPAPAAEQSKGPKKPPMLNAYAAQCHEANAKWWHNAEGERLQRNKGELLMLIVSEVAEAVEGERKDLQDDKLPHRKMAEVELVDALIRIFDYAGAFGYDLDGAFAEKMAFNATRADHTHEARQAVGGKKF